MAAFDLSISPPQLELILKPGATIIHTYQITNNTYQNLSLFISLDPWLPSGNDGSISYDQVRPNRYLTFSLSNADLKLDQPFTLPPQTTKQLVLKIKSSDLTPLGDSYYTLFVNQNTSEIVGDLTHSAITAKIGSHILISTATTDQLPQTAKITNFSVLPRFKDFLFTPLRFSAEINNSTDYFFAPLGTLTISKNNLTIKQLTLTPNNILAQHSRAISCDSSPCTLPPPFWPGKYTATISLDSSSSASTTFYVFPFSLIGILIPLILLIVFYCRLCRR